MESAAIIDLDSYKEQKSKQNDEHPYSDELGIAIQDLIQQMRKNAR